MKGFFGNAFDFDGNGELDALEQAADFAAFMGLMEETQEDSEEEED